MTGTHDAVIVGGGPAGMAAAWSLRDRDILLLEQEGALGGRLKSVPDGDYWLNVGAHLFPGPGSRVEGLTRDLDLPMLPIPGAKAAVFFDGRVYSRRAETYPLVLPLTAAERVALVRAGLTLRRGVRGWHAASRPHPGEPEPARRARMARFQADRTMRDLLGPLPERVDAIFRAAGRRAAAELEEQTAGVGLSLFAALWSGGARSTLNMSGGSGRLGEEVAARLGPAVEVGATVTSVRAAGDQVTVRYHDSLGQQRSVSAQQVVVAVPPMAARALVEGLPQSVDRALASVGHGPFVCLAVSTGETGPTPWDGIYAMTTPGLSFDMWFNHANPLRHRAWRRPGGSLMCYAGGGHARELLELSDAQVESRLLADLLLVCSDLRGRVREALVQRWPVGNVYRTPDSDFSGMERYCAAPGNVVHFAGDYFGELGNIEVATASGFEAAEAARAGLRTGTERGPEHPLTRDP